MNLTISKTSLDYLRQYDDMLKENFISLDTSIYNNGVESPGAVHLYCIATDADTGNLAGISIMTRYLNRKENNIKIYHRVAYTFPEYRGKGVWKSLMRYKIQYCKDYYWNDGDDTTHHVVVKLTDERYAKLDWRLHSAFETKVGDQKIFRATWYTSWRELKNLEF